MAKILIKNGPPEFDMIYAYFRQGGGERANAEVEMTLGEEGDGMTNVCYVHLAVLVPWTASTKTWKFWATIETKESRISHSACWKAFVGTYSFKTRTGEGVFIDGLPGPRNINLGDHII